MKQFTSHHNILQPLVSRKSNPNCYQPNILCIYSAHITYYIAKLVSNKPLKSQVYGWINWCWVFICLKLVLYKYEVSEISMN